MPFEPDQPTTSRFVPDEPTSGVLGKALKLSPAYFLVTKALPEIEKAAHGAGEKVTDFIAQSGSPRFPIPPEAAAAAGAATGLGVEQAPYMGVGAVGGLASKVPLRAGAEWFMQSALKPTIKALENLGPTGPNAERAIATMLDQGHTVGRGGINAMQGKVDALKASIQDAIKGSGATIDRNAIASRLDEFTNHIKATDLAPQDRLAAVQKLYDQIISNTHMPQHLPVEQAQRVKQAIYQRLKDAYGELGSDSVQAQKYLARGAKEEISAAVPGVAQLNAKEAELINALEIARHRAFVTGNKDIGGLGWLTANPATFVAFMADRSPLFKSIVAQMMNKGAQNAPALGVAAGAAHPLGAEDVRP